MSYHGEGQSRASSGCPDKSDPLVSQCDARFGCMDAVNNTFGCVRTRSQSENTLFCSFTGGFVELYNLAEDEHQLFNLASMVDSETLKLYEGKLAAFANCTGSQQCFRP